MSGPPKKQASSADQEFIANLIDILLAAPEEEGDGSNRGVFVLEQLLLIYEGSHASGHGVLYVDGRPCAWEEFRIAHRGWLPPASTDDEGFLKDYVEQATAAINNKMILKSDNKLRWETVGEGLAKKYKSTADGFLFVNGEPKDWQALQAAYKSAKARSDYLKKKEAKNPKHQTPMKESHDDNEPRPIHTAEGGKMWQSMNAHELLESLEAPATTNWDLLRAPEGRKLALEAAGKIKKNIEYKKEKFQEIDERFMNHHNVALKEYREIDDQSMALGAFFLKVAGVGQDEIGPMTGVKSRRPVPAPSTEPSRGYGATGH